MRVYCRTNLDLRSETWPTELPALPRVGDRIESGTVHHAQGSNFILELEVCSVSWECRRSEGEKKEWIPRIELHMTSWQKQLRPADWRDPKGVCQGSITAFYDWYAPKVGTTASAFI